jgi:hypothetical protein
LVLEGGAQAATEEEEGRREVVHPTHSSFSIVIQRRKLRSEPTGYSFGSEFLKKILAAFNPNSFIVFPSINNMLPSRRPTTGGSFSS